MNINDLDKKIKEALKAGTNDDFNGETGELSLAQQVSESFYGKSRWLIIIVFGAIFAYVGLGIYTATEFFASQDSKMQIAWATGFLSCLVAISMMKVWYWGELNKNNTAREIKRLELQVAHLANSLK
jgi:hypothetical protein